MKQNILYKTLIVTILIAISCGKTNEVEDQIKSIQDRIDNLPTEDDASHYGSVYLSTQETLDDFAERLAKGTVYGNIYISGNDIISLESLSKISSVEGELSISNTKVPNLAGLENLIKIGGTLTIEYNNDISAIKGGFGKLTLVGGILIENNNSLTEIEVNTLVNSANNSVVIRSNPALTLVEFSNLETIEGSLTLEDNANLSTIYFNVLTSISGSLALENGNTEEIDLTALSSIGESLIIRKETNITNLSFLDNLKAIYDDIIIEDNTTLESLSELGEVESSIKELSIKNNPGLTALDLSGISGEVTSITIEKNNLPNLNGLSNITSVKFGVSITHNSLLNNLDGLNKITSIGGPCVISENEILPNLNGLKELTQALSMTITNNNTLNNFCGIQNLCEQSFPNGIRGSLTITGNQSNPSKQDIINTTCP